MNVHKQELNRLQLVIDFVRLIEGCLAAGKLNKLKLTVSVMNELLPLVGHDAFENAVLHMFLIYDTETVRRSALTDTVQLVGVTEISTIHYCVNNGVPSFYIESASCACL